VDQHLGRLVIIGGGEDKEGRADILSRVVECAGGASAVIGVVPTASRTENEVGRVYEKVFGRLGARSVRSIPLARREQADDPELIRSLGDLTAVFFTGGDQLRITSTLGGTRFHHWLVGESRRGLVVAGTSAGASMMTDTMIVEGDSERAPTLNTVRLAAGMGFWAGAVVDQHFTQRGRIGRLLAALAENPAVLGVGLDENTAIEVDFNAGAFTVLGERTVTVLDGRPVRATNASESRPGEPLALTYVTLHVLPRGWRFDWERRRPLPASADEGDRNSA
jgi:cyanophycinase